jgi:NAD(P)-dependent dehydrogenase (short-subunit alcohol dehydrogenase family)
MDSNKPEGVRMRLKDKVAIVVGSGSGMGKATAELFAKEGARVVVTAHINVEGGEAVAARLREEGGDATFVQVDVADSGSVQGLVGASLERYGRIDVLFNNAAPMRLLQEHDRPVAELPEEVWDRMIDVVLKGTYLCSKYVIPQMIEQGGGSIINNGSVDALVAAVGYDAYTAAKGGVVSLTRSMAGGYARHGIRVNCISPGVVATEVAEDVLGDPQVRQQVEALHMLGIGSSEDVAYLAVYLASDESRWMTGSNLVLDGGYTALKTSVLNFGDEGPPGLRATDGTPADHAVPSSQI